MISCAGGERDEVGEALERHRVAVVDVGGDRVGERLERSGHRRRPQNETGTVGACPDAISSGSAGEAFSHTSSIDRFDE